MQPIFNHHPKVRDLKPINELVIEFFDRTLSKVKAFILRTNPFVELAKKYEPFWNEYRKLTRENVVDITQVSEALEKGRKEDPSLNLEDQRNSARRVIEAFSSRAKKVGTLSIKDRQKLTEAIDRIYELTHTLDKPLADYAFKNGATPIFRVLGDEDIRTMGSFSRFSREVVKLSLLHSCPLDKVVALSIPSGRRISKEERDLLEHHLLQTERLLGLKD